MAKFKAYDYRQRIFLPVFLEDQLMPGTLEFAVHTRVETRLDNSGFEQRLFIRGKKNPLRLRFISTPLPIQSYS
jgi:hypothetical protein